MDTKEKCPTCGFTIREEHGERYCSEFCASAPQKVLDAFRAGLTEGDFAQWPCANCGCIVEDEYRPGAICGECGPRVRARNLANLLRRALPFLEGDLREEAEDAISRS